MLVLLLMLRLQMVLTVFLVQDGLPDGLARIGHGDGQELLRPGVALFFRSGVEEKLRVVLRHEPNDVLLLGIVVGLLDGRVVDEYRRAGGLRLLKVVRILEEAEDLPAKDCVVSFPGSESGSFATGL